jgi:hypothetical protein
MGGVTEKRLSIDRQALLWLRVPLALVIATVVLAAGMVGQAWAGEYVYKLHLTVKGTEEVSINNGPEPSSLPSSVTQTAEWTWSPKDVDVVIPKYEGPPGFANEGIKKYLTFDEKQGGEPIGSVKNNGFYVSEPTLGDRISEPYTCSAPIISSVVDQHRVIVNALNPEIDLETVFVGSLAVKPLVGEIKPCGESDGQPGTGYFFFPGEEETGERMQVGMTINQAEIGSPLPISGPALDQSNVETSEKFSECGQQALGECTHKFKLSGEYELEPVCEGTLSVAHLVECAGGSGSSNSSNNSNNNPSNNNSNSSKPGGGEEAKKEEEKKAEEAAKAAAKKAEEKKKEEEAKKKHAEEAKASVKIESVKLTSAGLQIKIKTSEKGTVTIAGAGLTKLVAKTLPAGIHTAKVDVSKKARAKHQKTRVTVSLKVGGKTLTASKKITL